MSNGNEDNDEAHESDPLLPMTPTGESEQASPLTAPSPHSLSRSRGGRERHGSNISLLLGSIAENLASVDFKEVAMEMNEFVVDAVAEVRVAVVEEFEEVTTAFAEEMKFDTTGVAGTVNGARNPPSLVYSPSTRALTITAITMIC
jgi:hypothetical protein